MTFQDAQPVAGGAKYRRLTEALPIAVFLAPAVFFLVVFLLYPLVSSFELSLLDWNGLGSGERFVGLENWYRLAHDALMEILDRL